MNKKEFADYVKKYRKAIRLQGFYESLGKPKIVRCQTIRTQVKEIKPIAVPKSILEFEDWCFGKK